MKKSILNAFILSSLSFGTFAQTLVQDINPGTGHADPREMIGLGSDIYFRAKDGTNGWELWKYDGSTASIISINASGNSSPESLTVAGSYLYFVANDGIHGWEIWKTNGTNTSMLPEINLGNNSTKPSQLFAFNNEIYFQASDGINGSELWKTDGTTNTLIDINPGSGGSLPQRFEELNNILYFSASDGINGIELWKYDGTNASLVQDINAGSASSNPSQITQFGTELIFAAGDALNGYELWKFDGTSASLIQDINSGSSPSNPDELTVAGNNLYFTANDGIGNQLMKYDGNNVTPIVISTSTTNPNPYNLSAIGNELFFVADDGINGYELRKYDGNTVTMIQDITPGAGDTEIYDITELGELVYFYEDDNETLWKYNGDTAIIVPIDTTVHCQPRYLTVIGSSLYLSAVTAEYGQELWKIQGSFAGVENIVSKQNIQLYPNPSSHVITLQGLTDEASYQVINVLGEVVLQGTASNGQPINVETLTNGLYFLRLSDSNTIRFIKE